MNLTPEYLANQKTSQLQEIYLQVFGKPTSNRNAQALRKRLAAHGATLVPAKSTKRAPKPNGKKVKPAAPAPTPIKQAAPKANGKKAPEPVARSSSRAEHTPRDIGIGKVLSHKFRDGRPTVSCTVVAEGFKVGAAVHPSLGAAAKAASGQAWNGMLFWGLAPFPKHRKKAAS